MKIWLTIEGEKSGPHESFSIRDRIESGELDGSEMAWYEGADEWVRLDTVPLFTSLFQWQEDDGKPSEILQPPPLPVLPAESVELLDNQVFKPKMYYLRRLFARVYDLGLYMSLLLLVFRDKKIVLVQDGDMGHLMALGMAYVIFDGMMTHLWCCSPGKFFLGLRVVDSVGHRIALPTALIRSLRVWILGWGMWIIAPIAMLVSWLLSLKFGFFIWDLSRRNRVVAKPLTMWNVLGYLGSIFLLSALMNWILPVDLIEDINNQTLWDDSAAE